MISDIGSIFIRKCIAAIEKKSTYNRFHQLTIRSHSICGSSMNQKISMRIVTVSVDHNCFVIYLHKESSVL